MGLQGKADLDNAPAQQNEAHGPDQAEDKGTQIVNHGQGIVGGIGGHGQTQDHCAGEHSTAVAAEPLANIFGHGQTIRSPTGGGMNDVVDGFQLLPQLLGLHLGVLLGQLGDGKAFAVNPIALAENIANTLGEECIAVPAVVPGIQIGVGKLLGNAPEYIFHGLPPQNKDGFLLGAVEGALPIRQLVPEVHFAGCVAHHSVEEQPGVLVDGGFLCGCQRSLGNIKDTLPVLCIPFPILWFPLLLAVRWFLTVVRWILRERPFPVEPSFLPLPPLRPRMLPLPRRSSLHPQRHRAPAPPAARPPETGRTLVS